VSRVVVTGAAGQLGTAIVNLFSAHADVVALTRRELDLADTAAIERRLAVDRPDVVINCAAFNDVDGAEDRPDAAYAVNRDAVRMLANVASECGATLVHYSSDFVFNSDSREPHSEDLRPAPRGVYASSKLLGEWFATALAPGNGGSRSRRYVLRVESLFGSPAGWTGRRGTLDHIVDGLQQGREVKVFTDRIVSPSYSTDIAAATKHLIDSGAAPGLYHCVNDGHANWHDVAAEAARILDVPARLVPITVDQLTLRVPRPRYCALSTKKLAAAGFAMPTWQDALRRWLGDRTRG